MRYGAAPSYSIKSARLAADGNPVPYKPSPNVRGHAAPTLIVIHDTAGHLHGGSSVSWLTQRKAKASAHFVVERDGSVTQMVELDRIAWHAGKSAWRGRSDCNSFAIGIEIVSPGRLVRKGATAVAWFGEADLAAIFAAAETEAQALLASLTVHGVSSDEALTNGQRPTPTADELLAELPTITWPA